MLIEKPMDILREQVSASQMEDLKYVLITH